MDCWLVSVAEKFSINFCGKCCRTDVCRWVVWLNCATIIICQRLLLWCVGGWAKRSSMGGSGNEYQDEVKSSWHSHMATYILVCVYPADDMEQ